jgi:hypothetical protein
MIAAAVLASLWAQAEPAPPEPAPPLTPAQAEPAPVAMPVPPPAQPPPVAPVAPAPEPKLAQALAVWGRVAYRLGPESDRVGPSFGFALGAGFEHRYLKTAEALELGVMVDFSFARFATSVARTMDPPGAGQPYDDTRALNQTSFALLQTLALALPSVRPFAAVGGGATISYFSTPELALMPGSMTAVQPIGCARVGVDLAMSKTTAVTVAADYTHAFTRPAYTSSDGQSRSFLGDTLTAGAGLRVRF